MRLRRFAVVYSKLAKSVVHNYVHPLTLWPSDIIYIDLCLTFITELCLPIMANGYGWPLGYFAVANRRGGLGSIKKFGPVAISELK